MKKLLGITFWMMSLFSQETFVEKTCYPFWEQKLSIDEKMVEEKTQNHNLLIFNNDLFGSVLVIDHMIQMTEIEEPAFHEMLVHVPLMTHPNPRHVLILGGCDGGALREVLKHKSVKQVILLEKDQKLIEETQKYLSFISNGAFEDPRVHVVYQEAHDFFTTTKQKFDAILCDTLPPQNFYPLCKSALTSKGIVVTYNRQPPSEIDISSSFTHFATYLIAIPSDNGGFLRGSSSYTLASHSDDYKKLSLEKLKSRHKTIQGSMQYYNPAVHKASFALPQYCKKLPQKPNASQEQSECDSKPVL